MATQSKSSVLKYDPTLLNAEGILINNIENERQTIYTWNDNHPESKKKYL